MENQIFLNPEKNSKVVESLNALLADFQIYYQNLRGFHWNIKGKFFFGLHAKYEELYNDAAETVDAIAERILSLGGVPFHSFKEYLDNAKLPVSTNVTSAKESIQLVLSNNQHLLKGFRNVLKKANDADDEGTASMVSGLIETIEKRIWMLDSASRDF